MRSGTSGRGESRPSRAALETLARAFVASLLTGGLLVACAGSDGPRLRYDHEFVLAPGQAYSPDLDTALLLPIDATNGERVGGLDVANEALTTLLVEYLGTKGIRVEQIDAREFQAATVAAYREMMAERQSGASDVASTELSFSEGIPRILAKLEKQPDVVVVADLVMRTGRWNGARTMVWDGVRRRDRTAGHGSTTGTGSAASLFVAIHTPDGARVFSGYGGLDLVYAFNLKEAKMEIRDDRLQDEAHLSEGVCVAFYPYFGAKESCYR